MIQEFHGDTGPERDKDSAGGTCDRITTFYWKVSLPQNNQDKWFVTVTQDKEFHITELTMEKMQPVQ